MIQVFIYNASMRSLTRAEKRERIITGMLVVRNVKSSGS